MLPQTCYCYLPSSSPASLNSVHLSWSSGFTLSSPPQSQISSWHALIPTFFPDEYRNLETFQHRERNFRVQGFEYKRHNTPGSSLLPSPCLRLPETPHTCDCGEVSRGEPSVLRGLCSKSCTVKFDVLCWGVFYEVRTCSWPQLLYWYPQPLDWKKGGKRRACNLLGKGVGGLTWS